MRSVLSFIVFIMFTMFTMACLTAASALAQPVQPVQAAADPGVGELLRRLEDTLKAGRPDRYLDLLSPNADRSQAGQFIGVNLMAGATDAVVQEADRVPLPGSPDGAGYRLMVEIFVQRGKVAQVATWRLDIRRTETGASGSDARWGISDQERLTAVYGLYQLSVDPTKQYDVRNLTVTAEDLTVRVAEGSAFVAETDFGPTALILLGRGQMEFAPAPASERGQVRIFSGSDVLRADFDAAFIRLNPEEFNRRVSGDTLTARPVNARDLKRAQGVFTREAPKSFSLDLGRLNRDHWWVIPSPGDTLFELKTRKYDTLTYVRSQAEPEDIRVFDRKRKRNISIYSSKDNLAARGPFYSEDDFAEYDVLDYNIDAAIFPEREWLQGRTSLRIRAKQHLMSVTIRLAETLTVQSVTSRPFGRLLPLRIQGQDSLLINFPTSVAKDGEFVLTIAYGGRMLPQRADHETAAPQETFVSGPTISPVPFYLYSNRSHWYPQAMVTDYATATLRLSVPAGYECVGSGEPADGDPVLLTGGAESGLEGGKQYLFRASQPVRYLASVVSRFTGGKGTILPVQGTGAAARPANGQDHGRRGSGVFYDSLALSLEASPRQLRRGREVSERAADVVRFYGSLLDDVPYQSFTLALVESEIPGGHSPAYFALLNQPLPTSPFSWKNDPVYFDDFPDFFLAHELAHQWWGQAVGWSNYHEQWLSEGFAQYFAALYAKESRGEDVFTGIMRQMRRWALDYSDQGPVYLGYRLGHIKGQGRVFRALVYNKGAVVLHMLRRLIGDEAFFNGLRRFYTDWRFRKAGSDDLRKAMETEAKVSLERFFERWIYESAVPRLTFSFRATDDRLPTEPGRPSTGEASLPEVVLRFEQTGDIFDVPVTVTLKYADGTSRDVIVRVTDAVTEMRVPLTGALRSVDVNRDYAALADITR